MWGGAQTACVVRSVRAFARASLHQHSGRVGTHRASSCFMSVLTLRLCLTPCMNSTLDTLPFIFLSHSLTSYENDADTAGREHGTRQSRGQPSQSSTREMQAGYNPDSSRTPAIHHNAHARRTHRFRLDLLLEQSEANDHLERPPLARHGIELRLQPGAHLGAHQLIPVRGQ